MRAAKLTAQLRRAQKIYDLKRPIRSLSRGVRQTKLMRLPLMTRHYHLQSICTIPLDRSQTSLSELSLSPPVTQVNLLTVPRSLCPKASSSRPSFKNHPITSDIVHLRVNFLDSTSRSPALGRCLTCFLIGPALPLALFRNRIWLSSSTRPLRFGVQIRGSGSCDVEAEIRSRGISIRSGNLDVVTFKSVGVGEIEVLFELG